MRKPLTVALLLVMPLVLLGFAGVSQALTLHDDFNAKPINPALTCAFSDTNGPVVDFKQVAANN